MLALQRSAGNEAVRQVVAQPEPAHRLRELSYRDDVSAEDVRTTREYQAFLAPRLAWQWRDHATAAEALQACWLMLDQMRAGVPVDWDRDARTFLFKARRMLVPEVIVWKAPVRKANHHYRIELKSWIPHLRVVDPVPAPGTSHYRGDGHSGYEGSHRVLTWVEFSFDGLRITAFQGGESYGTSHRDYDYPLWGKGTETQTATGFTARELRGEGYFWMRIDSKIPIPIAPAPAINSELEGFISCTGLFIHYITDLFPSHGVRISRDGKIVKTEIVFDARYLPVEGDVGAMAIFVGLTSFENTGSIDVQTPDELAACTTRYPIELLPTSVPP